MKNLVSEQVRVLEQTDEYITVLYLGKIVFSMGAKKTKRRLIIQGSTFNTCLSGTTIKWLFGFRITRWLTGNYYEKMTQTQWTAFVRDFDEIKILEKNN